METEIAIVGAGIIGISTTFFLSKLNHEVTLFDRKNVGEEASGRNAGSLSMQNKPQEALTKLKFISGDDIYNELSQILIAEIYDYMLNNSQQATIYYMSILENFKRSIHYESVRLRLEKIYLDSTL